MQAEPSYSASSFITGNGGRQFHFKEERTILHARQERQKTSILHGLHRNNMEKRKRSHNQPPQEYDSGVDHALARRRKGLA